MQSICRDKEKRNESLNGVSEEKAAAQRKKHTIRIKKTGSLFMTYHSNLLMLIILDLGKIDFRKKASTDQLCLSKDQPSCETSLFKAPQASRNRLTLTTQMNTSSSQSGSTEHQRSPFSKQQQHESTVDSIGQHDDSTLAVIKKERKLKPIIPLPRAKSNEEEKSPTTSVSKSHKKRKVFLLEKRSSSGSHEQEEKSLVEAVEQEDPLNEGMCLPGDWSF